MVVAKERGASRWSYMEWHTFSLTVDSSAGASETSTETIDGLLHGVYIVPGTMNSATDGTWDLALYAADDTSHDLLNSAGLNRDTADRQWIAANGGTPIPVRSTLTPTVTNATDDDTVEIIVVVENR